MITVSQDLLEEIRAHGVRDYLLDERETGGGDLAEHCRLSLGR